MKKKVLCFALILFTIISLCIPIQSKAATLKLNKAKATLEVDATLKLKLSKISAKKVTWSSDNKKVATISKKGVITAKGEGKVTITATYSKEKYKCEVIVVDSNKAPNSKVDAKDKNTSNSSNEEENKESGGSIPTAEMTTAQKNAYKSAKSYFSFSAFSRQGIIDQLTSEYGEGYEMEDAIFAIEALEANGEVDWNEQAYKSAKSYLSFSAFSLNGLIEQLESEYGEQFTHEQAVYGANKAYNE